MPDDLGARIERVMALIEKDERRKPATQPYGREAVAGEGIATPPVDVPATNMVQRWLDSAVKPGFAPPTPFQRGTLYTDNPLGAITGEVGYPDPRGIPLINPAMKEGWERHQEEKAHPDAGAVKGGLFGLADFPRQMLEEVGVQDKLHEVGVPGFQPGSLSRRVAGDPLMVGGLAKQGLGAAVRQLTASRLGFQAAAQAQRAGSVLSAPMLRAGEKVASSTKRVGADLAKGIRAKVDEGIEAFSRPGIIKEAPEAGMALNPVPGMFKVAKENGPRALHFYADMVRDPFRELWTESFGAVERLMFSRVPKKMDEVFKSMGLGEPMKATGQALKAGFQTQTSKHGVEYVQRLQDVYAAEQLTALKYENVIDKIRKSNWTDGEMLQVSRWMRPRVSGVRQPRPDFVTDEFAKIIDDWRTRVNELQTRRSALGGLSPEALKEYDLGYYYPRVFENTARGKKAVPGDMSTGKIFHARDAHGAFVRMDADEVGALLGEKWVGGEAKRLEPLTDAEIQWLDRFEKVEKSGQVTPAQLKEANALRARDAGHRSITGLKPWEMTRAEVREKARRAVLRRSQRIEGTTEANRAQNPASYGAGRRELRSQRVREQLHGVMSPEEHADAVAKALKEGKEVPRRVLADYPELVAQYGDELGPVYYRQQGGETLVKFKTQEELDSFLARLKRDGLEGPQGKPVVKETFKPLTEEELLELGEVKDVGFNMFNAVGRLERDVAKLELHKLISENDEWAKLVPKGEVPPEGWKRLDDLGKWGKLRNHHVRPDVFKDLSDFNGELLSGWQKGWRTFLRNFKASKTVWSPRTHVRNFFGNSAFAYMADNVPPWFGGVANTPHYWKAAQILAGKHPKLLEKYIRNGVLGTQYTGAELGFGKELQGLLAGKSTESAMRKVATFLSESRAAKSLAKVYDLEDAWFRLSTAVKAEAPTAGKFVGNGFGMSAADAVEHVNRYFANYRDLGPAIKWLRNSPIGGPFASFGAESLRIAYNGIKHRPIKFATTLAFPFFARSMVKEFGELSDEEYEHIAEGGPMALPIPFWRNDRGERVSTSLDYWHPQGFLLNGILGNKFTEQDDSAEERFWERTSEIFRPFLLANPVISIGAGLLTGEDTFANREIYVPGRDAGPGSAHLSHIAAQMTPGFTPGVGKEWRKGWDQLRGRKDYMGRDPGWLRTGLDIFAGINTVPQNAEYFSDRHFKTSSAIERSLTTRIRKVMELESQGRTLPGEAETQVGRLIDIYVPRAIQERERGLKVVFMGLKRDLNAGRGTPEERREWMNALRASAREYQDLQSKKESIPGEVRAAFGSEYERMVFGEEQEESK